MGVDVAILLHHGARSNGVASAQSAVRSQQALSLLHVTWGASSLLVAWGAHLSKIAVDVPWEVHDAVHARLDARPAAQHLGAPLACRRDRTRWLAHGMTSFNWFTRGLDVWCNPATYRLKERSIECACRASQRHAWIAGDGVMVSHMSTATQAAQAMSASPVFPFSVGFASQSCRGCRPGPVVGGEPRQAGGSMHTARIVRPPIRETLRVRMTSRPDFCGRSGGTKT